MIHFYLNLLNGFSLRLKKQRSQSKNLCLLILGELLPKKKEWEYFHVDYLNKIYHPSSQSRTWDYGQSKQFSERICSNNLKDWSQLWFIYISVKQNKCNFYFWGIKIQIRANFAADCAPTPQPGNARAATWRCPEFPVLNYRSSFLSANFNLIA